MIYTLDISILGYFIVSSTEANSMKQIAYTMSAYIYLWLSVDPDSVSDNGADLVSSLCFFVSFVGFWKNAADIFCLSVTANRNKKIMSTLKSREEGVL